MAEMKVLYDYQIFDIQNHGGISRCFTELYSHRPQELDAEIAVLETDNVYLQELGFSKKGDTYRNFFCKNDSLLKHILFKLVYNTKYGHPSRWDRRPDLNKYESIRKIKEGDYDIFHPTFDNSYFFEYLKDKPYVLTVHDMIPELFTQYYARDDIQIRQKRMVIPNATHIIAVSERTKKDLISLMDIPEERISIVYHGADESPYHPFTCNGHDYEYILYVGGRFLYKNFAAFCRDCIPILKRHRELKVICTGTPFTKEETYFFEAFGMADRFIHTFVETKQELLDLYHNAVAFVYPSLYEGFGIPILEAYKAGCPVMLNHTSCFPEIAGDAAVYFNMNQRESDFEEQFETLYHMDGNERKSLIEKQRERLKRFSWEKSAKELANVYKSIL